MSGKLFAFNLSKKIEKADEKASNQWVGDRTARSNGCSPCQCSGGQGYGMSACYIDDFYCWTSNDGGYYICDSP
jgi:hypothetical protein